MPVYLYVNVDAIFAEAAPLPKLERLQLGRLPVPQWIADWLLKRAILQAIGNDGLSSSTAAVKSRYPQWMGGSDLSMAS